MNEKRFNALRKYYCVVKAYYGGQRPETYFKTIWYLGEGALARIFLPYCKSLTFTDYSFNSIYKGGDFGNF